MNLFRKKKNNNKTCPKCKKTFYCNTAEGCWCEKVFVSRDILKDLRQNYIDCLCKECLESYSFHKN
jgi:hypothetical protein